MHQALRGWTGVVLSARLLLVLMARQQITCHLILWQFAESSQFGFATVEQSGVQVCAWHQLQGIVSACAGEQVS